jgi:hypothetical protein
MHWQQGAERMVEKSCIASLEPIPIVKGELVHFFCIFGFWGCGLLCEIGLTGFGGTGLTGFGNQPDRFVLRVGTCSGELAYVQGELLFALVVCALCLSMVLSRTCRAVALA